MNDQCMIPNACLVDPLQTWAVVALVCGWLLLLEACGIVLLLRRNGIPFWRRQLVLVLAAGGVVALVVSALAVVVYKFLPPTTSAEVNGWNIAGMAMVVVTLGLLVAGVFGFLIEGF